MILYRPVGLEELVLIYKAFLRRFPARLPEQPIFYPVLNQEYATQIARDWNTRSGALAGYVTSFELDDSFAKSFPIHQVGASHHRELWVPSHELGELNDHILGMIRVVGAHFAPTFSGIIPKAYSLQGKDARQQLATLWGIYTYSLMDFHGEIAANAETVFAHYPYWEQLLGEGAAPNVDGNCLLPAIRKAWSSAFPQIPLGFERST